MKRIAVMLTIMSISLACGISFGQENGGVPKEILSDFQKLVGRWEIEGTLGDTPVKGEWSARWTPGKTSLLYTWTGTIEGETEESAALTGWDSKNSQILTIGFDKEGADTSRWKVVRPGLWEGEATGIYDGKEIETKMTFEIVSRNEWKLTTKGIKNIPDEVYIAKRVPRKDAKRSRKKKD